MKTTKIILITALVTLGAVLFGQASQVEFITTSHSAKSSRFENLVYEEEYCTESWMLSPFESSVAEADICLEPWMSSPFEVA